MVRFLDLCAGIGGFREGMQRAGFTCVGWCEIDKFAQKAYRAIHKPEGEYFYNDITTIDPSTLPDFEVLCAGFPCQSFSVAGLGGGFEDTRGTIIFEILRIAEAKKPKYIFLENVRGLLSHDDGWTFATILSAIWECGYDAQWQVLNSQNFRVPQSRPRVYIVGHLRGEPRPKILPFTRSNPKALKQIIGGSDGQRVYDTTLARTLKSDGGGQGAKTGLYAVLTPDRVEKRQNGRRIKTEGEPMFTLTAQDRHGLMIVNRKGSKKDNSIASCLTVGGHSGGNHSDMDLICYDLKCTQSKTRRGMVKKNGISHCLDTQCFIGIQEAIENGRLIRRLTPLECFRLQAFPDQWYYTLKDIGISDTQLYRLAGNAVTVNVIEEIARRLKNDFH